MVIRLEELKMADMNMEIEVINIHMVALKKMIYKDKLYSLTVL